MYLECTGAILPCQERCSLPAEFNGLLTASRAQPSKEKPLTLDAREIRVPYIPEVLGFLSYGHRPQERCTHASAPRPGRERRGQDGVRAPRRCHTWPCPGPFGPASP